jgi:sulfur-carrier protein
MAVQLSYFAWVRDRMGMASETLMLPGHVNSIAALIAWLAQRNAAGTHAFSDPARIRAAIDGVMASPEHALDGAREIALFPPVTGG